MKRIIYGLTMAAVVALSGGCEKEKPSSAQTLESKKPSGGNSKSLITLSSPVVTSTCHPQFCNAINMVDEFMINMIQISNNHSPTTIKYAIYNVQIIPNTTQELASLIAQFNCNLQTTRYASNSLDNGAKIMVYAMHTTDTPPASILLNAGSFVFPAQFTDSDFEMMIMGNAEGTPGCGDPNG